MTFRIIPVIDLLGGVVVHAKRGARSGYQPIASRLCDGSRPVHIVEALLRLAPFDTIYIADLDAIMHAQPQHAALTELIDAFAHITWWVDAGFATHADVIAMRSAPNLRPVCGTESLPYTRTPLPRDALLSLDHDAHGPRGDARWFTDASAWPQAVIAMTLSRVGAQAGPDLALLQSLKVQRPDIAIYAAGGVRNVDDLHAAQQTGAAGALVATALHDGTLNVATLTI